MLVECIESVKKQTVLPASHTIYTDYNRIGPAKALNIMFRSIETEWAAPLADDDIFYPQYIERLIAEAGDADMVYPWCRVTGTREGWIPNAHFDADTLRVSNYIPATVLIRKSAWEKVGGYPEVVCEDHAMWLKLLDAGLKIKCVPEILWEYRFHGRNISDGIYAPWEV